MRSGRLAAMNVRGRGPFAGPASKTATKLVAAAGPVEPLFCFFDGILVAVRVVRGSGRLVGGLGRRGGLAIGPFAFLVLLVLHGDAYPNAVRRTAIELG